MKRLLGLLTIAMVAAASGSALSEEPIDATGETWMTYSGDAPVAYVQTDYHTLIFACASDTGDFLFKYQVRPSALNAVIAAQASVDLVFATDQPNGVVKKWWARVEPLDFGDGDLTSAFSGDDAADFGRMAMAARETIHVGLSPHAEGTDFVMYNAVTFPAKGSTAAIGPVVAKCG